MPDLWNRLLIGDCRAGLATLPPASIHCAVTSPPYWALRDYKIAPVDWADGWTGCFGNEPTPDMYVAHSVEVFQAVKRVLRDDGVLFVNLGDSYAMDTKWGGSSSNKNELQQGYGRRSMKGGAGIADGNQVLIPHRVAMAMQTDGWILRSTIIWGKKSPMPESVSGVRWLRCRVKVANGTLSRRIVAGVEEVATAAHPKNGHTLAQWEPCAGCPKCEPNGGYILRRGKWRPTTAHEYIFMFSKSDRYFCDGDAAQEPAISGHPSGNGFKREHRLSYGGRGQDAQWNASTRNPRSIWMLSSEPLKEKHFAAFPSEIPRRCITAGTSAGGCCEACGSPYAPVVESERVATRPGVDTKCYETGAYDPESPYRNHSEIGNRDPQRHVAVSKVTGYRATCKCKAGVVPCRVLDPFMGSGTTAQTARALGRDWIGCEQSEAYAEIAQRRIDTPPRWQLRAEKRVAAKPQPGQLELSFGPSYAQESA